MLEVANASVIDVEVGVSMFGTEGVIDRASRLTAVLQVTVRVNLQRMKAWLNVLELSNN